MNSSPEHNGITELIRELKVRQVRELAWCCFGPDVVAALTYPASGYRVPLDDRTIDWLRSLDGDPGALLAHLSGRRSTRLGLYFESLWQFYWQAFSGDTLISHNRQINGDSRTLGAFDFILASNDGHYRHIEAAVKFYLGQGEDLRQLAAWVGPNANDRLDIKVRHLTDHQLPLLHRREAIEQLRLDGMDSARVEQHFLLRGWLFAPARADLTELPPGVNREALQGRWWYLRDFTAGTASGAFTADKPFFSVIPRNHWLAPVRYHRALQPLQRTALNFALISQVGGLGVPKMVARLEPEKDIWQECERFFVVPDHWPATAKPSRNT